MNTIGRGHRLGARPACRRWARPLLLALLLSWPFAACRPRDARAPVRLTLWHAYGGELGDEFEALVAEFNTAHPGIVVEPSYGGNLWTLRDKLLTAVAASSGPDVCQIDQFWCAELAEVGAIVKLGDMLARDPSFDRSDVEEKCWQTATYRGEIWTMPFAYSNIVLYYNRELFEAAGLDPGSPPETWEQLVSVGRALTRDTNGDGVPEQWGLTFPLDAESGCVYYWLAFLWQNGGELFDAQNTHARFQGPAGVEALQYWVDLVHKHGIVPAAPPPEGFERGVVAMTLASSARLAIYTRALGGERLGVGALPAHKRQATGVGGANLAILASARDPQAAWEFVRWMTGPEANLRWSMRTGYLPLRKSVVASPTYQAHLAQEPRARLVLAEMDHAIVRPNIPAYAPASRELGLAIERAVLAGADPATALTEAARKVDALLGE